MQRVWGTSGVSRSATAVYTKVSGHTCRLSPCINSRANVNSSQGLPAIIPRTAKHFCPSNRHQVTRGCKRLNTVELQDTAQLVTSPDAPEEAGDPGAFSWTKQWWPILPVEDLDPKRPKAITVMGVQLVVWKDGAGQWRAFKDACPHRLAPLSEGRVEADGTLLCSYHAWRFSGSGNCTAIPQSLTPEAEATATKSKRSCALAFPTQEKVGLLWVWLDDSDARWIDASASPVIVPAILQQEYSQHGKLEWFARDLPYGYEILVENFADPAHFPSAHHKVVAGMSRYKIAPVDMVAADAASPSSPYLETPTPPAFTIRHSGTAVKTDLNTTLQFTPPMHLQNVNDTATFSTQLYCVPVAPGKSRVLQAGIARLADKEPTSFGESIGRALFKLFRPVIVGMISSHRTRMNLFDSDNIILHKQEAALEQQYGGQWRDNYYLAAPCDLAVAAVRKWIDDNGRPFPDTPVIAKGPIHRALLLDRYQQHTVHCKQCQQQVKKLDGAILFAQALGAACLFAACCVLGSVGWQGLLQKTAPFISQAGAAAAALLALAVWSVTGYLSKLQQDKQQFFFVDYVHADKA